MRLLELKNVVVEYPRRGSQPLRALAGVDLRVPAGEIIGLVGETGCGKSTLARAAVGLVPIASGGIMIDGHPISTLKRRARARSDTQLQLIFQDPFSSLNPRRKAGRQIGDALSVLDIVPRRRRPERVRELVAAVGLPPDAANRYPHQFSGGQRQRIAIARSLAAGPDVIIADEPFASLDSSAQAQILNLLVSLSERFGLGLLLITHNLAVVRYSAKLVAVMYLGLVVEVAPTDELWSLPLHPYTEALIASVPTLNETGRLPPALPGAVPDPADPPKGCRFHPRCPYSFDRCRKHSPPLIDVAPGRRVACWLHEKGMHPEPPALRAMTIRQSDKGE